MITAKSELEHYVSGLNEAESQRLLDVLDNMPRDPDESGRIASHFHIFRGALIAVRKHKKGKLGVRCDVCGTVVPSIHKAIEDGWVPETWIDDEEPGPAPVCPDCIDKYFEVDGEYVLRQPGEFVS